MNEPQHRIWRQVLDFKVRQTSRNTAWSLQNRLSLLHRQRLVPLIDQCCTELSPGHLHRIESLVIDLGNLSIGDLEHDLLETLKPRLWNVMAEQISEQDQEEAAGRHSASPESPNELEMLAFFADTGNVPWWADSSRSNLVDISLGQLIRRAPRPLATWIRGLARDHSGSEGFSPSFPPTPSVIAGRGLRRIVLHCDDERLVELFSILESPSRRSLTLRGRQPQALLHACRAASGASSARFRGAAWRNALWLAVLQTACLDEAGSPGSEGFWREVLARVATELHTSYASLVSSLRQVLLPQARPQGDSRTSSSDPLSPTHPPDISIPGLEEIWRVLIPSTPSADADSKSGPPRGATPNIETEGSSQTLSPSEVVSSAPLVLPEGSLEEIERILDRLRRGQGPLKSLFAALRSLAGRLPNRLRGQWWAILKDLEDPTPHEKFYASYRGRVRDARDFHPTRVRILLRLLAPLIERRLLSLREDHTEQEHPSPMPRVSLPTEVVRSSLMELQGPWDMNEETEEDQDLAQVLKEMLSAEESTQEEANTKDSPLSQSTDPSLESKRETPTRLLENQDQPSSPAPKQTSTREREPPLLDNAPPNPPPQPPPTLVRTPFSETESVCVENSGLILLWPFLGHFFKHLDLMTERITPQSRILQFRSPAARQRAVGLLQYLVTEDPSPPEYQVTLGKVLCGMGVEELFEPGDPISSAESEECTNLLSAAIAQAPVLKSMSTEGFRGTFLVRNGMLGNSDGAWCLRVERQTYDLVLDRLPWGVSWVKLPWMEAPLQVEW